jgi:hypothetical protein
MFSPTINNLNIKARKTEILNKDFKILSQNISPIKQIPPTTIFSPEKQDYQPTVSARAFSSFSKTILQSARYKEPEEFKDSDDEMSRN